MSNLIKANQNFLQISMRLSLNFFLFILVWLSLGRESFALTDYKIKKICRREKRESVCIKKLKEKRSNLQKGNMIPIQVIPYKR